MTCQEKYYLSYQPQSTSQVKQGITYGSIFPSLCVAYVEIQLMYKRWFHCCFHYYPLQYHMAEIQGGSKVDSVVDVSLRFKLKLGAWMSLVSNMAK